MRRSLHWSRHSAVMVMAAIASFLLFSARCAAAPVETVPDQTRQQPAAITAAERLAASVWQRVAGDSGDPSTEIETWAFFPTHFFRWSLASDQRLSLTGAWSVISPFPDSGMIVLVADPAGPGKTPTFRALSFSFPGDRLRLGESLFAARPIPEADSGSEPDAQRLAMAQAPRRYQEFALWTTLTSPRWVKEGAGAPNDPDAVSFARDGSYQARIAPTDCRYSGTWSLTVSSAVTGDLRLSVPGHSCAPHGARATAYVREVPVTLQDDGVMSIGETKYVVQRN